MSYDTGVVLKLRGFLATPKPSDLASARILSQSICRLFGCSIGPAPTEFYIEPSLKGSHSPSDSLMKC